MNANGISVVIPNYNGTSLLKETLPTVFNALDCTHLPYEIIISDDCSTDDSVDYLQRNFPNIKLILNKQNKGFSPTINQGIFAAVYDVILLLNSDVKLTSPYFESLLHYFDDTETFGVMGRIVGWKDEIIQDAAKYPKFEGAKIKTSGNYYYADAKGTDRIFSMYLSGANALVSREKIIALGGFDELYAPFYVEDFDLSLRAWRMGWKCYYEHNAICRHQVSVSIKAKSKKYFINYIYYRNKMYLHAMHLSGSILFWWYIQLIPEMLIRLFTFRFYYFKSLTSFFTNRNKMLISNNKLTTLSKKENRNLLSVQHVVQMIRNAVDEKRIIKF